MKPILQRAKAILGTKLVKTFQETCGDDQQAFEEMLHEALRALAVIRKDDEWTGLASPGDQE
jgi:hypothetical protein